MRHIVPALALAILLATSAAAHHNWSAIYDVNSDIEIEGVISSIDWVNPHVRVSFTVDAGTPNERVYTTESNSVASLTRMDVTPELLSVGARVRVAGYRSRTRDDDIFMNHLLLPDHREIIFLRTAEARWPDATRIGNTDRAHGRVVEDDFSKRPTSIFGVWTTIYGAEGSHRALGGPVDWTEKARELQAQGGDAPADAAASCDPRPMPGVMGAPYPIQIIDQGDTIIIHAEFYDSIREVHMNTDHSNPPADPGVLGYSTGNWVGDTLVVSTTMDGSNSGMQIHETFHLSGDRSRLLYTSVITDPEMRTTPTLAKKWWQYQPGAFVQPYGCTL